MTPVADRRGGVLARLATLLGEEGVGAESEVAVARPADEEEVSAVLRLAGEEGWSVLPEGAGVGGELSPLRGRVAGAPGIRAPELILSTLRLRGVLEHEPADLTVRAGAGRTLGEIQDAVRGAGQWLALDPPGGEGVTLGGMVATGSAGPLRILYGRPRDQLLGLILVDGAGRILRLGGKVVKNVAGFDLVRLSTGSRGTLGVVTEVTFRLYPLPEADRTMVWSGMDLREGWELGRRLARLPLPLAGAELLAGGWPSPLDGPGVRVLLRLVGSGPALDRMRAGLLEAAGLPLAELEGEASARAWATLAEEAGQPGPLLRVHVLPERGRELLPTLQELPFDRLALHLLVGTFRIAPGATAAPGGYERLLEPIRIAGGSLRPVRRWPGEGGAAGEDGLPETGTDAGGRTGGLAGRIAAGFDPRGILPGSWREGWR